MEDTSALVPEYVPLFPLPSVVLFPRTVLPLHIFEPRYREMVEDALASNRMLAVALLKPGFEPLYYSRRAPVHEVVGVGSILEYERVDDGNFNLLLGGIGRARIIEEVGDKLYRLARVEPAATYSSVDDLRLATTCEKVFSEIRTSAALDQEMRQRFLALPDSGMHVGAMIDVVAARLPADPELRQKMMDELDHLARAKMLLKHLQTLAALSRRREGSFGMGGPSVN